MFAVFSTSSLLPCLLQILPANTYSAANITSSDIGNPRGAMADIASVEYLHETHSISANQDDKPDGTGALFQSNKLSTGSTPLTLVEKTVSGTYGQAVPGGVPLFSVPISTRNMTSNTASPILTSCCAGAHGSNNLCAILDGPNVIYLHVQLSGSPLATIGVQTISISQRSYSTDGTSVAFTLCLPGNATLAPLLVVHYTIFSKPPVASTACSSWSDTSTNLTTLPTVVARMEGLETRLTPILTGIKLVLDLILDIIQIVLNWRQLMQLRHIAGTVGGHVGGNGGGNVGGTGGGNVGGNAV
ncbi:hypothetical protein LTR91_019497 [Friedmanniomyces endolithicus]|uniref:Secreted protein n=1 Tax=Friedmanniomyces endolithicus TaxID=329885 RepID=A0AAN6HE06_9PEZI|nr:hypothetical protein LTR94_012193 [Friedmanniomyces endolithicus]KAK0779869.1 hypothetical protein LTR38_014289 [Friedmanniomyces endolithicus]KAK0808637.1 hypothetical protein LTR59_002790 [Friedmanniomyces endolithicus]KAK0820074.1 hypothetical protein LTR75_001844 [Friedmanniomyces endolithicus]KAK0824938.1 hypothetical protein LTR03_017600 [Friedmanniomyces endolithicus]